MQSVLLMLLMRITPAFWMPDFARPDPPDRGLYQMIAIPRFARDDLTVAKQGWLR
jgi:hypothetical protein